MRKSLLAIVGCVLLCPIGAAYSADIPASTYLAPPIAASAFYNWTGFYVGANAGYGFGRASTDFSAGALSDTTSPSGLIGGGQFGYNWQIGRWLLGAEADFQWSGELADGTVSGGRVTITHTDKLTWFATGRARLGLAYHRWLVYGTGGIAYGAVDSDATVTSATGTSTISSSDNNVGWVVGIGLESALRNNWTWRLEYLYLDLGTATFTDQILRAGVNYRF